jgi:predicted nuclease of predicted toxin-antitoxin system
MRLLIDAQLPKRIARLLAEAGHDAIHTLDLPLQNRTSDADVVDVAKQEGRVVVSKDEDFVNSHHLLGQPEKLLQISTGNISNRELVELLTISLPQIVEGFETVGLIELSRTELIIHV